MFICIIVRLNVCYIHNYIHRCALNCGQFKTTHNKRESESVREERESTKDKANQTNGHTDTNIAPFMAKRE